MRASVEAHLGSRQVARVIYGSVIGLALIVALQGHPPSAAAMVGWLLGTAVTVGLAEFYAEVVGAETRERHRVTRAQLKHMLEDVGAVAIGIAFPAIFFLLATAGLMEIGTAFSVAKWSGLGLIGFYGFWAARFAGARMASAVAQGAAVALIGAALILLKSLLH